jgi:hypothetical protein
MKALIIGGIVAVSALAATPTGQSEGPPACPPPTRYLLPPPPADEAIDRNGDGLVCWILVNGNGNTDVGGFVVLDDLVVLPGDQPPP